MTLPNDTENKIREYILWYNKHYSGYSPTIKEIANKLYMSKTSVYHYISLMEARGTITRRKWKNRGISVNSQEN